MPLAPASYLYESPLILYEHVSVFVVNVAVPTLEESTMV